jgi:hypothetical protein
MNMARNSAYGNSTTFYKSFIRSISEYNGPKHNLFAGAMFETCIKDSFDVFVVTQRSPNKIEIIKEVLLKYIPNAFVKIKGHSWTKELKWMTIGMSEITYANYKFFEDIIQKEIEEKYDEQNT